MLRAPTLPTFVPPQADRDQGLNQDYVSNDGLFQGENEGEPAESIYLDDNDNRSESLPVDQVCILYTLPSRIPY